MVLAYLPESVNKIIMCLLIKESYRHICSDSVCRSAIRIQAGSDYESQCRMYLFKLYCLYCWSISVFILSV